MVTNVATLVGYTLAIFDMCTSSIVMDWKLSSQSAQSHLATHQASETR